ncbi:MAG: hypothetical protein QXW80_06735 [Candidatus Micrarchaeia archaeon]
MSKTVNLGGDRLGSGAKMNVTMHGYSRSTHDLSYIWRSTMAAGTLVPFMKLVALPGDTFDIRLNADVKTLPTVGPLFGSFKMQLDIFQVPMRLYNAGLHMNRLNIGLDMSKVKFPIITLTTNRLNENTDLPVEFRQINQSSLLAYLGIRGNGWYIPTGLSTRNYNAIPLLAYWDIYKNYYANKQEGIGAYITRDSNSVNNVFIDHTQYTNWNNFTAVELTAGSFLEVYGKGIDYENVELFVVEQNRWVRASYIYNDLHKDTSGANSSYIWNEAVEYYDGMNFTGLKIPLLADNKSIIVKTFPLENIDKMRDKIMSQNFSSALVLNYRNATSDNEIPYKDIGYFDDTNRLSYNLSSMNGLALKTYQSDIFNNWLNTESIDGNNGISAITAIDTSSGKFTIDTLNLSKKVYDMLNRVAVSGGSYEDWLSATYDHQTYRRIESPVYLGGLSKEVIFQEVVSNSNVDYNGNHPLGSLAGRGTLSQKHKGGYIVAKIDEPSYLIGIVSLTPRIDYSQGNDWDIYLNNLNELHKPALDEIGFQDLITNQMAFWEEHGTSTDPIRYSAGKQPAWLNYMTNYNKTFGHFANSDDMMYMTLNRRYEMDGNYRIKDLTTYIDPKKFNYIFADTERDAQNFWVQIASDIEARRKMSAKLIPNL